MAISDFISANSEILKTIQRVHPQIYDEISKDELTTFSLLLQIESFLQESTIQYMSNFLAETSPLTAETYESLINHAITRGYTPKFCKPAEGKVSVILPIYNSSKNSYLNSATNIFFDKETVSFKGTSTVTNNDVVYRLKNSYKLVSNGFNAVLYEINEEGETNLIETSKITTTINNESIEAIGFDLSVIQIDNIISTASYISSYDSLDFPTVSLPILPDDIYRLSQIKVQVDNINASYIPVLTVADMSSYYYTIRMNENSVTCILSNGVYGKKVLPTSNIDILVYLTSGKAGNIYQDSLELTTQIINQVNGQSVDVVLKNYRINNGENIEDYRSIKISTLSTLISNDRLVTVDDYVTMLESIYYGDIKVLPTARLYSYGSNDVSIYLAVKKDEDPLYGTPIYFKTDTKSLIVTDNDLQNNKVFMKGDYLIIPSNIIIKECNNTGISPTPVGFLNESGVISLIDETYNNIQETFQSGSSNITNDIDKKWLPVFSYVINTKYPMDNKAYITSGYKNIIPLTAMMDATIYSVNIAITFGTMKSVINTVTQKSEFYFDINVALKNIGNSEFSSIYLNNIDNWLALEFISSDYNTIEYNRLDHNIFVNTNLNSLNIPYKLSMSFELNTTRNITVRVLFKIANSNLSFIQVCQTLYKDIDIFSPKHSANLLKVSTLPSLIDLSSYIPGFQNNQNTFIIYDVPVISAEEFVNNEQSNSYMYYIQDLFSNILTLVNKKGVATTSYSILFGRTKGAMLEYMFQYEKARTINGFILQAPRIHLPITIVIEGKLLEKSNAQSLTETIKQKVMLFLQSTTSFFVDYSSYDLLTLLSDVPQIDKLQVHFIEGDFNNFSNKIDGVKSLSNISLASIFDDSDQETRKWKYRFFVPSLINTNTSRIIITLT